MYKVSQNRDHGKHAEPTRLPIQFWQTSVVFVFAALLSLLCYQTYDYVQQTQKDRVNMEKSSGRSGKHSNPKARQSAEEQYQKVEEELKALESKPGKTAEEAKRVIDLKRLKKHWRGKKDWGGEHHSQKHKGN